MKSKEHRHNNKSKKRNFQIFIAIAVILIVSTLLIASQFTQQQGVQKAIQGKAVGDFMLSNLSGESLNLSDFRGKYVLLNAWATWCPPCRAEMPDLNNFYNEHKDKGFEILAINAGETKETASAFANMLDLQFSILLDTDGKVLTGLGITGFPTSILIDPEGKVAMIHIGMIFPEDLQNKVLPYLQ